MGNKEDLSEKILRRMLITSYSRFEASKRLKRVNFISFISTTIASLGLILIPLLDLANLNKNFSAETLTCFQIFLAVSVLVYSASISTANYQIRAKEFLECGDSIKNLMTELEVKLLKNEEIDYIRFEEKYRAVLNFSENHEDIDYINAENLYNLAKSKNSNDSIKSKTSINFWKCCTHVKDWIKTYAPFTCLMILEVLFISDMVGTSTLKFLHKM